MGKTSKKKHKKHRRRHSSSSSSSSDGSTKGDEQWEEVEASHHHDEIPTGATIKGPTMPTKEDLEKMEKPAEPVTFALEPLDFDALGSYRRENKQAMKKAQNTAELEAIMAERELNPNLRQKPVESNRNARTTVGDAGLEWHRRAYERCKQQAKEEQRPLNEIVSERYGSMDKLLSLINEGEQLNDDRSSSSRRRFLDPNAKDDRHHHHHHRRHDDRDRHHHRHHHHHHEKKSWKRTTEDEGESTPKKPAIEEAEPPAEPEVKKDDELISEENLLELRKQLIRAELAGDDEMIEMLRNEIKHIDQLRGNPSSDAQPEGAAESNERKTLVLTTIDRYGVEKPVHDAHEPGRQRQHGHVTKQDRRKMKKEMRKLRDQDKDPERQGLSLTDLVEMERHSTTNLMPVLPSNRSSSSLTADRHILSSTRHLTGWSRVQALADQRKRQQAFEQCWLCIENLSKSYIFGLLDHWFLCAPPQQSLVEGHCFLVPIQHHSSRFQLDDDVLAELDTLKEQLTELFRKQHNQLPIFIETFKNPRILPHLYVECIPVPIHQANFVPMYFRKALLESESMWATNKKLLELNDHRSRTLKSVIPKGLPYFCVEFPVDRSNKKEQIHGYAHMIEERGQFPLYFGREILGGLMELDNPLLWMRPASKEAEEVVKTKCTYLKELWKKNTAQSSDN